MTQQTQYIRPSYGFWGSFSEIFNAVGAIAHTVNNVASSSAEFTEDMPRLAKASGEALSARAEANLRNQLELQQLEPSE
jgi:hypothetical protein